MRVKGEILLAHLKVRLGAGAEGPLPDLAVPLLKCIGERAAGMSWYIRNADLIMHRPHIVAEFNEATRGALRYDVLLALLDRVSTLNEITIVVPRGEIADIDVDEQLLRGDFSPFRVCIDLRDSTEWIFFSDSSAELACAAAVVQAQNDLSGDAETAG